MEFQQCLNTRRSVRKYKSQPVEKDLICRMVESAILAPSWKNSQTARFYAASGQTKKELSKALPDFNRVRTENAPYIIVSTSVDGISGFTEDGGYVTHLKDGFQYFDNALAVENLCLTANDLGLGTLIMGLYDEKAVRRILDIPENEVIVCLIAVGYPDTEPKTPPKKPLEDVVRFKD